MNIDLRDLNEIVTLDEINEIVKGYIEAKAKQENLALMVIKWDGYTGFNSYKESLVARKKDILAIKQIIVGQTVYFKAVNGTIDENEVSITTNASDVSSFLIRCSHGHEYNHSF